MRPSSGSAEPSGSTARKHSSCSKRASATPNSYGTAIRIAFSRRAKSVSYSSARIAADSSRRAIRNARDVRRSLKRRPRDRPPKKRTSSTSSFARCAGPTTILNSSSARFAVRRSEKHRRRNRPRPMQSPSTTRPTAEPQSKPIQPTKPPIEMKTRMEPLRVSVPARPQTQRAPTRSVSASSNRIVRKKASAAPPTSAGLPAEALTGLVLAAATGLLLAGTLGQSLVSAGIATVLIGISAYQAIAFLRRPTGRPSRADAILLAAGILSGVSAAIFHNSLATTVTALALAAAFPFALATRRLLRSPQRAWLAIATAIAIAGHGLVAALDPAYRLTLPLMIGILGAMPWPAALAVTEILRRQSVTVLRRQLIRAERDVQRKDYEQSLATYDRAIAAAGANVPGAEIPWYGKGATLVLLGRYEEALRAIDTALDINPRNEVAWVNKGNALTRMGQLLDALRCFNAAIKVNPLFEVAWNNKGNALARLGKFEDALRCYDRALEIDPGYRGVWVNKGFVLTKLGRFDEAASCADHALLLERRGHAEPA